VSNPTGKDSWGDCVPLPDANKRSPRVYTNLQNIDLSTVTFANVEATGDPIQIEDINEDELRRIVLVNLARMCVAGEWTGLLEAGGGTQYALEPIDASQLTTYNYFVPWGRDRTQSDTPSSATMEDKAVFRRFIAPLTGTIGNITVQTGVTQSSKDDCKLAIYSTTNGLPGTRIGDISIDVNGGAGLYTSSSWATAPPLEIGLTYWIGFAPEGGTKPAILSGSQSLYLELGFTHYPGTGYCLIYNNGGDQYDLPSTITDSELIGNNSFGVPVWGFKYA